LLNNRVDGDIFDVATQIDRKAHEAMLATKDLLPSKGRSAGLGDRALGHIDPGAKSCQVMISAVCQEILKGKK
jgi:dihydroxyacetone kinase-like protein